MRSPSRSETLDNNLESILNGSSESPANRDETNLMSLGGAQNEARQSRLRFVESVQGKLGFCCHRCKCRKVRIKWNHFDHFFEIFLDRTVFFLSENH